MGRDIIFASIAAIVAATAGWTAWSLGTDAQAVAAAGLAAGVFAMLLVAASWIAGPSADLAQSVEAIDARMRELETADTEWSRLAYDLDDVAARLTALETATRAAPVTLSDPADGPVDTAEAPTRSQAETLRDELLESRRALLALKERAEARASALPIEDELNAREEAAFDAEPPAAEAEPAPSDAPEVFEDPDLSDAHDAFEAEPSDVFTLRAIHSLPDEHTRFYDAITFAADGERRDARAFSNAIAAIEHLDRRSDPAAIFCAISAEALRDDVVLTSLIEFLGARRSIHERLVLVFDHDELLADLAAYVDRLSELRSQGFTLAIDAKDAPPASADALTSAGFELMKVDVEALENIEAERPDALAARIRAFRRSGLDVIAANVRLREELDLLDAAGVVYAEGRGLSSPWRLDLDAESEEPPARQAAHDETATRSA